jgi:hypothetical protein
LAIKKKSKSKNCQYWVFQKTRIKELASSRYLENNINKEPLVMGISKP